jgi:alpha-beta hydrolase superfamily lysophospholipase
VPSSELIWHTEVDDPQAVVLVLHGGRSRSRQPARPWQPAVWWMRPFADAVAEAGNGRVAVARLRYAVRGWNGAQASPLPDARAALDQLTARHPGVPVGLLGHSMGGRVAFHLAADARVRAIAALAPWVERPDVARGHPGLHVLVMHGTADRMTSPTASRLMADAMADLGADVTYESVKGATHAMLRPYRRWREEPARFLVRELGRSG